jgi:cyclopropane-fatty-acyl-phospholipid synthase
VEHYGVEALGIVLSEAQAAEASARIAAAGLSDRCRVEICDYRELRDVNGFDKIASIGMVEHVGQRQLPRYFASAYRMLKPGGLFLNHGIVNLSDARPTSLANRIVASVWKRGAFIDRYVFPDGCLVPLADMIGAAEASGFETRDAESLREHYAKTLRHWVGRLEANASEAVRLVGEQRYRVWRLYLAASAHAFTRASIGIVQTLLAKPDATGRSNVPATRRDLYA